MWSFKIMQKCRKFVYKIEKTDEIVFYIYFNVI